ncbi:hypothetical protein Glove_269g27 [Diversispora epigaea]|uniref:Uncharacterized protein n=1 Tax=Diversispora epigaea TaxID=1348612 RepID=A0A397I6U2_9GLOM|nr:hypothetical protein Glove_269g27 [Diversispora epigaea]
MNQLWYQLLKGMIYRWRKLRSGINLFNGESTKIQNYLPKLEELGNENFITLKNTLQNCLPHIRYLQIFGEDILHKNDFNFRIYHLEHEKFCTFITNEHETEIFSWIDTTYPLNKIPYEFQLILRVTILKVADTDEILGGFNPLEWDKTNEQDTWMKTKDSIIFSLKNVIEETVIQYIEFQNRVNYGICFGNYELLMETQVC